MCPPHSAVALSLLVGGPDAKNAIFAAYRSGQAPGAFDCLPAPAENRLRASLPNAGSGQPGLRSLKPKRRHWYHPWEQVAGRPGHLCYRNRRSDRDVSADFRRRNRVLQTYIKPESTHTTRPQVSKLRGFKCIQPKAHFLFRSFWQVSYLPSACQQIVGMN